jgi:hypothetical protein
VISSACARYALDVLEAIAASSEPGSLVGFRCDDAELADRAARCLASARVAAGGGHRDIGSPMRTTAGA